VTFSAPVLAVLSARLSPGFPNRLLPSHDCWARLWAFCTITQVQQNGVLWYARYPCLIQAETEPPGSRPPSPGTHAHRNPYVAIRPFWSSRSDKPFRALSRSFRSVVFQPRGTLSVGVSRTTLLSIAIAVVIRRHPRSACYPCLSGYETEPPGRLPPAPGSHRDGLGWACLSPAVAGSRQATFASRLPKSDGPLCLF